MAHEMTDEQRIAAEERRVARLDEVGAFLEGLKDEAVRWRSTFEMEWVQDYQQYNLSAAQGLSPTKQGGRTPASNDADYRQSADNITRAKVIITAARLGDMLFPTNEANWGLDISPRPDVPEEMIPPPPSLQAEDGSVQQRDYTPEELEEVKREIARRACTRMRDTIKDQFEESHYDEAGRAAIFDGCLYGTGVLRGPILKNKRRYTFGDQPGPLPAMVQAGKPTVEHVDLWSFFPQPSRSIEECEHAFVLHILPPRAVRKLARQPGFDPHQVARLLAEEPQHGALVGVEAARGALRPDAHVVLAGRYSVWEYRGPVPKDGFEAFVVGMVAAGMLEPELASQLLEQADAAHTADIDCEVWLSQGKVLKIALSTLPPGELGFYVFNYEKNPNSIFGHGVAYLCRDDQHATNQLWHAMMLNSMMSAGPQIGVRKGALIEQPGGGRALSLTPDKPRVWALNDEVDDINKALSVFVVPNVTDKIMGLYERAKSNADEHTMTPLIAQGEPTQAVPTSSGMAILMNAANVVMRRLAKAWDDDITVPLVSAFYDWNMTHNPDPSIRGDYCVIPQGASHLLIKDVQAQHLQIATQLFTGNPKLEPYMKPGVFARKNIEMLDLSPDEMLLTDEQVQAEMQRRGEQPDPDTLKAQAAIAQADAAKLRAEKEAEYNAHRMQFEREERLLAHRERMADIETRERIQVMQLEAQRMALLAKMAEMEKDERMEMERIIADLTKHGGQLDLQQYQADLQASLKAEKIASDERKVEREIQVEKPNPRVQ